MRGCYTNNKGFRGLSDGPGSMEEEQCNCIGTDGRAEKREMSGRAKWFSTRRMPLRASVEADCGMGVSWSALEAAGRSLADCIFVLSQLSQCDAAYSLWNPVADSLKIRIVVRRCRKINHHNASCSTCVCRFPGPSTSQICLRHDAEHARHGSPMSMWETALQNDVASGAGAERDERANGARGHQNQLLGDWDCTEVQDWLFAVSHAVPAISFLHWNTHQKSLTAERIMPPV